MDGDEETGRDTLVVHTTEIDTEPCPSTSKELHVELDSILATLREHDVLDFEGYGIKVTMAHKQLKAERPKSRTEELTERELMFAAGGMVPKDIRKLRQGMTK